MERQLCLKSEDVGHAAIVTLRPYMEAVGRVDELRVYANPTAVSSNAALEYRRDVQLSGDFTDVAVLILESKDGRPRRDSQVTQPGERRDELLGKPIAEV